MRVAVLGLGEAGGRYAEDLSAAGWHVHAYDPAPTPTPPGVVRATSLPAAVAGADLVLSLTGASAAVAAARAATPAIREDGCFADLNTTAPQVKQEVAGVLGGVPVADVAVLAPVPRLGAATPVLVSGPGAEQAAAYLRQAGATAEVLAGPVGAAAGRKLLRSVFMKGLAAAVLEAVAAGRAAGCEQWVRDQIAGELGLDGPALVDRLLTGSRTHAGRRADELRAARDHLATLGVPHPVCDAALAALSELAR
jgi:3-hydroxyisobutyrate dehydrogenase